MKTILVIALVVTLSGCGNPKYIIIEEIPCRCINTKMLHVVYKNGVHDTIEVSTPNKP